VAGITSVFAFGAGWVHLQDFLATGNRAAANWGFGVLFGSVVIPTTLMWLALVRARRLHLSGGRFD
ncbi:MAG: DUF6790 family protein, partial [Wenzhouxiangellaceae bacterium]|nr:DUF6790 family protein [Wenzhouxiangellaceae bacterium]